MMMVMVMMTMTAMTARAHRIRIARATNVQRRQVSRQLRDVLHRRIHTGRQHFHLIRLKKNWP